MNRLTRCNHCVLDEMQADARARGQVVIMKVEPPTSEMAGWISARYSDKDEPSRWFKQLTARCVC